MTSKDTVIEQLLMIHQRLVRIAYNAGHKSPEVLEELRQVAELKAMVLKNYEK